MHLYKNKRKLFYVIGSIILLLLFFIFPYKAAAQYKFHYDKDYLTTLTYGAERHNGFRISLSLVAMFTAGAEDRKGFRLGAGVTMSQTIDNWIISTGFDTYKAKQRFGIGTTFVGVTFDNEQYGASYYLNRYFQGDKQTSGVVGVRLDEFRILFEDDILAYPFTGFKAYDRYRTAALEVRFKGFMLGTNVYTTDMNGITDVSSENSKGVYQTGRQISSPVYVGYTRNDLILRYGLNNRSGGFFGQNGWHQHLFGTPDFKYGSYKNQFIQFGVDKPYTLY
ncbi:MAG: polymorphic toxin type 23 domain-containing protein [Dysgonomonas sp.]